MPLAISRSQPGTSTSTTPRPTPSCRTRRRPRVAPIERLRCVMEQPARKRRAHYQSSLEALQAGRRRVRREDIAMPPTSVELTRLAVPGAGRVSPARLARGRSREPAGGQRRGVGPAALRPGATPPRLRTHSIPADPLRVVVNVADQHSGVAGGDIEMRPVGSTTWHGLPAKREASDLVAYVDDERFRRGAYEFRARAVDNAGNEASTGRRTDGSAATLRLPARIDTRLVVGMPRRTVRRRVVRRQGRKRVIRRHVRRLDANVVSRFGRTVRLQGRLDQR